MPSKGVLMKTITKGKFEGLQTISNERGVITAAAMDQRGSLQKSLAKERGVDKKDITAKDMGMFKEAVTEVLTPYASAILLDPNFGLSAIKKKSSNAGLLLAYESSGYDTPADEKNERRTTLTPGWNVQKAKQNGADAIKLLLYYDPFASKETNDSQEALTRKVGEECEREDIPFLLELVAYDHNGLDEKGPEFAKIKPKMVIESVKRFSHPKYKVDVLKVEVPVNLQFTDGTESYKGENPAYTKKEALEYFRKLSKVSNIPKIYLSAGVDNPVFLEGVRMGIEAGAKPNGVLCGRATWKGGIPVYAKQGVNAFKEWLKGEGVKNIQNLNKILEKATAWYDNYGGKDQIEVVNPN